MKKRLFYLDVARGLAVLLMFVDHISVSLVSRPLRLSEFPDIVQMPIMAIVEFAPPLFFLVFGFTLVYFYNLEDSRRYQKKIFYRGLYIFIWYKILCLVQFAHIINYNIFKDIFNLKISNDFVEVLGFFSFFLLWFSFFIHKWLKLKIHFQFIIIIFFILFGFFLNYLMQDYFTQYAYLKAILFEDKRYYHFGQLQRGAIALLGTVIAQYVLKYPTKIKNIFFIIFILGFILLISYFLYHFYDIENALFLLGQNVGKHPPRIDYYIFSLGGAMILFSVVYYIPQKVKSYFNWISILGKNALFAFQYHILFIFIFLLSYFNLKNQITYELQIFFLFIIVFHILVWNQYKSR